MCASGAIKNYKLEPDICHTTVLLCIQAWDCTRAPGVTGNLKLGEGLEHEQGKGILPQLTGRL